MEAIAQKPKANKTRHQVAGTLSISTKAPQRKYAEPVGFIMADNVLRTAQKERQEAVAENGRHFINT